MMKHGGDDTDFLFVAGGVITDQFLVSDHFSVHEAFESNQAFVHLLLF